MSKIVMPRLQLDRVPTRRGAVRAPRYPGYGSNGNGDGDVPLEYIGDPIHLTASITALQPGAQGVAVNVKALKNPGPGAIEIWAIKFRLRADNALPTGGVVSCRLDLGEFPLTNGFIPVYAFGRMENGPSEYTYNAALTRTYIEYIARLGRPIYVPEGAVIRPQLQHRGLLSSPIDVQISMVGRRLPVNAPPPKRLMLPFWAAYVSKTFALGTADTDISVESDLYNPFDVPLEMERFVGRINYLLSGSANALPFTGGVTLELESQFATASGAINGFNFLGSDALGQITCQIVDSNGFPVVKKLTPFRLVFDKETRSWPLTHDLPAGGYYLVSLASTAWLASDPNNLIVYAAQPCISMLGWREVA